MIHTRRLKSIIKGALSRMRLYEPVRRLLRRGPSHGCVILPHPETQTIEVRRRQECIIIADRHQHYIDDVLSDFDRFFCAVEPTRVAGIRVVDYSSTRLHITRPYRVPLYVSSFAENMSALEEEYFYKYRPRTGDVVLDCGAYCGESTYLFSKLVGSSGRVVAFEPDEDNFAALTANIKRHSLTNVVPLQVGVWSHKSTLSFANEGNLGACLGAVGARGDEHLSTQVEVMTLGEACRDLGVSHINYIKMDIEGAEIEAIEGAIELLERTPVHLAIANHWRDGKSTFETVERLLRTIGYQTETRNLNVCSPSQWGGFITWAEPGAANHC